MKIDGPETTNTTRRPESAVRSNEASRTKSSEKIDQSNEVAASDKVELSSQARDIQRAREVAQSAPEVRADKVEALPAQRTFRDGGAGCAARGGTPRHAKW